MDCDFISHIGISVTHTVALRNMHRGILAMQHYKNFAFFFLFLFLFFFFKTFESTYIMMVVSSLHWFEVAVSIFCRGVTINHSCYICIIWRKIFFKKWNNQQMLPATVWEDQSFTGKNLIFTILWVFRLMPAGIPCIKDFHACWGCKLEIFNLIGAIFLFSFFNYMGWILVVIGGVVVHFLSPAFLVIRSWFKKPEYNIYIYIYNKNEQRKKSRTCMR